MTYAPEFANWLASYPKSGNTWARMFLNAYTLGDIDINRNASVTLFDGDTYTYNAISPHPLNDMRPETTIYLRQAALLHMMVGRKYAPTIIKTHSANIEAGGVVMIPRPLTRKAVYLVRDPRDVACSYAKHIGCSIDESIVSMNNMGNVMMGREVAIPTWLTSWSNHVETWERDFVTRIRYEDLKEDPRSGFTQVLDTFGIKLNKPRLGKAIRLCDIDRLKKQEEKEGFIEIGKQEKFFGQGKGWKNELTDSQARRIEEDHGEVMEGLGYKLEFL